jgi:hypothetical protein
MKTIAANPVSLVVGQSITVEGGVALTILSVPVLTRRVDGIQVWTCSALQERGQRASRITLELVVRA